MGVGRISAMPEPMKTPAKLPDSELQSLASEWRIRAMRGDHLAHRMAQALEAEQRRRIRDTGLQPLPPADSSGAPRWWKLW
jgi:hypothetical protein